MPSKATSPSIAPPTRPASSNQSPEAVHRQAEIGIDVPSDGEFGKAISWNQYVVERLSGFELRTIAPGYRPGTPGVDRTRFKEFYAELDVREPMANAKMVACVGPVKYIGQEIVQRDIDNFKAALKGVKVEEAFMPVVAPSSVLPDRKDEYYKSEDEWLDAVTAAMRTEYQMIVDAGFIPADRRCALRHGLRPDGAARHVPGLSPVARKIRRGAQPRARRHPGGPRALSRLLGKLARAACERRAAARRGRPHPQGTRRRLCDRVCQSAPRARVAGVEDREAAARPRADPGRHQPRHQRGRASRACRRAHIALRQSTRPRERA